MGCPATTARGSFCLAWPKAWDAQTAKPRSRQTKNGRAGRLKSVRMLLLCQPRQIESSRTSNWVQPQLQPQPHEHDGEGITDEYQRRESLRFLLIALGEQVVERRRRQAREEHELRELLGGQMQGNLRGISARPPRHRADHRAQPAHLPPPLRSIG